MAEFVTKYENILKAVFLFGLFVSVFIFWPKAAVPYELPKVWFVSRWVEVMAIGTFFGIAKVRKERLDNWLIVLILIYLLVAITASVFGTDFGKSFVGNYYRGDGLVTLFHLLVLFYVVTLFSDKSWLSRFAKVASLTSIGLSVISLTQWIGGVTGLLPIETWDGGYGHIFGNPNFLAGYLIVNLPFTAYFVDESRYAKYWSLGLAFQIVGILLTNAWVGYFGIALFLVGWLFVKIKKARFIIFLWGTLVLGILSFTFINYQRTLETPISINPESRQRIFMKSMLAIRARPLTGYGWANFDKAFESVDWPIHMDHDVYVDKAHSSILEILTTTGIIGLLVYLLIIAKILINLLNTKDQIYRYILSGFILLVLHMQMNVISISEEILFWIIAAFSAKHDINEKIF